MVTLKAFYITKRYKKPNIFEKIFQIYRKKISIYFNELHLVVEVS